MSSPTPPKKAAPKAARKPLRVKVPIDGKEIVIDVIEGEDVVGDLTFRQAKDLGLAIADSVALMKRVEPRG